MKAKRKTYRPTAAYPSRAPTCLKSEMPANPAAQNLAFLNIDDITLQDMHRSQGGHMRYWSGE